LFQNPLISIIVPSYNREHFIKETLDSIINQSYKKFELIVVDDGSTDGTKEILKSYSNEENFKYILSKNWGGPARPRNIGLKEAEGEYIAFCDDDDLWHSKKLEYQVDIINNCQAEMVFTMQKQFGSSSIFSNYFGIGPLPFKVDSSTSGLIKNNCIPMSSTIVKKTLFTKVGGFSEKKSYIAIEDNDMWIRISKVASIIFLPKVLVHHRIHKKNIYENISNINISLKNMKTDYGYQSFWSSFLFIKQNKIYFLIRNIINKLYELTFHS
jgi:glycosyltransferase involved in cell wall biosynthesis